MQDRATRLVESCQSSKQPGIRRASGNMSLNDAELRGQHVRLVSVEQIEEGKERTMGFSPIGQPVQKRAVDRLGILSSDR